MTHFLSRLVERTRGTAPRVEPLTASRFEPASLPLSDEPGRIEVAGKLTAEARRLPTDEQAPTQSGGGQRLRPSEGPLAVEPDRDLAIPTSQPPAPVAPPRASAAAAPLRPSSEEWLVPTSHHEHASPATVLPGRRTLPARRRDEPAPWEADAARAPAAAHHSREGSPPVVRVTIGRIEVRAAAPPPAAPPRRQGTPAGPGLTLDAYLKSRRQEGRR